MSYKQLAQEQRYQIYALKKMGHNQTEIASFLGVHKSTISRELCRNRGQRGYRPKQAHQMALGRRHSGQQRLRPADWTLVEEKLKLDWSPEQIAGCLKKSHAFQISHEHLRGQKKRRKRYGSHDRRGKIPAQTSIEQRPAVGDGRTRLGDWGGDLIIGKGHKGAFGTLTERKSRFTLIRRVTAQSAEQVTDAVLALLHWVAHLETITADNGREFAHHQIIASAWDVGFYFAHPYASWERGTNENTNGLIRQYLPKHRDLTTVTSQEELLIMDRLNLRPRKCLAFRTPFEVFFQQPSVALRT